MVAQSVVICRKCKHIKTCTVRDATSVSDICEQGKLQAVQEGWTRVGPLMTCPKCSKGVSYGR